MSFTHLLTRAPSSRALTRSPRLAICHPSRRLTFATIIVWREDDILPAHARAVSDSRIRRHE
jgi:hypothetical protein